MIFFLCSAARSGLSPFTHQKPAQQGGAWEESSEGTTLWPPAVKAGGWRAIDWTSVQQREHKAEKDLKTN
jgi:hypothetical protein